jgi:predicted YcjX-like family ATPase
VPIRPPEPGSSFWSSRFINIPRFQPPLFDRHGTSGIDHLGLDEVLNFLLADKLGA